MLHAQSFGQDDMAVLPLVVRVPAVPEQGRKGRQAGSGAKQSIRAALTRQAGNGIGRSGSGRERRRSAAQRRAVGLTRCNECALSGGFTRVSGISSLVVLPAVRCSCSSPAPLQTPRRDASARRQKAPAVAASRQRQQLVGLTNEILVRLSAHVCSTLCVLCEAKMSASSLEQEQGRSDSKKPR